MKPTSPTQGNWVLDHRPESFGPPGKNRRRVALEWAGLAEKAGHLELAIQLWWRIWEEGLETDQVCASILVDLLGQAVPTGLKSSRQAVDQLVQIVERIAGPRERLVMLAARLNTWPDEYRMHPYAEKLARSVRPRPMNRWRSTKKSKDWSW